MAVIGSIRKRGGLLVVLVAGALALFVLQGLWSSNSGVSEEEKDIVAIVNGEDVSIKEQEAENRDLRFNYFVQNKKGIESSEEYRYQSEALENVITSTVWEQEMEKLGIVLTTEGPRAELIDMFDPNGITLPPTILQVFVNDSTKEFDPQLYSQQKDAMEAPRSQNEAAAESERKNQWMAFKNNQIKNRARSKYLNLLVKSTYVPKILAERSYMEDQKSAKFNVLYIPYTTVADSSIADTELNLSEVLKENKAEFVAQNDAVNVDLYAFKIVPSSKDTADLKAKADKLFADWKTTEASDTVYLQDNADGINVFPEYVSYSELPIALKSDSSLSADINGVEYGEVSKYYEPKFNARESAYHSYKVSDIKLDTIWEMEVTQLFYVQDEKLDSIVDTTLATLKNGGDIMQAAIMNAQFWSQTDPNFKQTYDKYVGFDGKLKNFTSESEMFANDIELREKLFEIEDTGLVETPILTNDRFRYIVYVHKTKTIKETLNRFLLSDLDLVLEPSDATRSNLYQQAYNFQRDCGNTKQGFYDKIKKDSLEDQKISVNLDFGPRPQIFDPQTRRQVGAYGSVLKAANDYSGGINDKTRQVLKWAWKNEVDSEPKFFQLQNAYVIAVINSKEKKGEVKPDALLDPYLRSIALKKKKQELIIDKLSGMLDGDLVVIAAKYNEKYNLTVNGQMAVKSWTKEPLYLKNNNPLDKEFGTLNEPAVVGKVFGLPVSSARSRSEPFRGERGIFIVETLELNEGESAPDGDYSFSQKMYLDKLLGTDPQNPQQTGAKVESAINRALRFNAEIEDRRYYHF